MTYEQIVSGLRGLSNADFEAAVQLARTCRQIAAEAVAVERQMHTACGEAYARRAYSTDGSETPLAYIVREFYVERGRFPTTSEILRRQ